MKKWISILCITLLLCSAMTMAVSAAAGTPEDPVVFTGLNFNMVKIPAGETYYATFTDTTGAAKRHININSTTDIEAGYAVTCGSNVANSDENGYCNLVVAPDANGTYLLAITNNSTKQATYFVNFYEVSPYEISDILLYDGENAVTTLNADTTLYVFEPLETGVYEVLVDKDAVLSHWNGSVFYVTGLAEETTEGRLEIGCGALGQSLLIGLSGVSSANITITKIGEYEAPASVEYVEYVNKHTPISGFQLPDAEMTIVDITAAQTVVLGADGIYRYGSANGPVLYVDMTGVTYADLYECYYPSAAEPADRLRGTYVDADGKTCGYDFITAMKAYADALDTNGYYYLTEDLANYLQMYGKDQGWFNAEYSPFEIIKAGNFNADSAWLLTACYDASAIGEDPIIPDEPNEPEEPTDPETPVDPENPSKPETPADPEEPDVPADDNDEPESPATGDVASYGAIATLLLASAGALTFSKKRK